MYKINIIPFFQGIYLTQQLYSFIPNYNYSTLNKKYFVIGAEGRTGTTGERFSI